ncbi:MAG: transketolase, partial [Dehalococcoidia bacterium]
RPGHEIIDHHTYAIVSDGDLMEGVSAEAASFAGAQRLGKLIYLYDCNSVSIEGDTTAVFSEDVGARFRAYGWHVVGPMDGMDVESVSEALREARNETERPSLIIARTVIGYGSPNKAGTGSAHGEPLGEDEVKLVREQLAWEYGPFEVPEAASEHLRQAINRGHSAQSDWERRMEAYRESFPQEAEQLAQDLSGGLADGWDAGLESLFATDDKPMATREASSRVMNHLAARVHGLTGGAGDLGPSTKTLLNAHMEMGFGSAALDMHNIQFGVREHAMGCIAGGMALHHGLIPYTATFLVFSDYMRPPMRLASLMEQRVIYVFSHDSIGLGEDGPTHQPIEHLMALRSVPNLAVIRPADATETAEAWKAALLRREGPTALIFTRQGVPVINRDVHAPASGLQRGGYVLKDTGADPKVLLIGTGSELHLALDAAAILDGKGISSRVVSLPSWELFDAQPAEYRDSVLPPPLTARVSVEAGTTMGWERYIGNSGVAVGIDHFGASAPYQALYSEFGFTAERMAREAEMLLERG